MSNLEEIQEFEEYHDQLVENFVQITGSDAQRAREFLEQSLWDLAVALERYYGRMDVGDDRRSPSGTDPDVSNTTQTPATRPVKKKMKEKSRFSTIADLDSSDSSDDEKGQAYYAGGSEHSGQQVLGPSSRKKKKDIIADILKSVQQIGAEVIDADKPSGSASREHFSGTGYRLGQTETDSQVVPSTSGSAEDVTVTLKLWKEGFNVNDGPLREYDDPSNKQFLSSVRQGLIPPELSDEVGNSIVQLNLEDHHHMSYTPSQPQKMKPFTGLGHVLGRPTPAVVCSDTEETSSPAVDAPPPAPFHVDETSPTISMAIRLPDGSRVRGVFNHTHTVGDIRNFINQNHPEYANRTYSLQTTIPISELQDSSVTVIDANLSNCVLVMKLFK